MAETEERAGGRDTMDARFEPALPLDGVQGAKYNPRFLSDEAFARLRDSISRFGVVKPIIVNGNGIIVAGHQRTKAMRALGLETTPAMVLDGQVHTHDEIKFNLLHNSVEENAASVFCPSVKTLGGNLGYQWLPWDKITVTDTGDGAVRVREMHKLVTKYGNWGSIIVHPVSGRVLLNSDYAVVCQRLHMPVLAYYPPVEQADPIAQALAGEYGVYDASQVVDTPYVQNVVQPKRLRGVDRNADGTAAAKGGTYMSLLWETLVKPRLTKTTRLVDFGAGHADYAQRFRKLGYDVQWYEPFFMVKTKGGPALDVRAVVRQIIGLQRDMDARGLFPMVMCDSVLNACPDDRYHEFVIRTLAALTAPDGVMLLSTRSIGAIERGRKRSKATHSAAERLAFLDETGREINFKSGVFYTMKYHSSDTLHASLSTLFGDVEVSDGGEANLLAVCAKPKAQDREQLRAALEAEFNMPYPDEYRHNMHGPLVEALLRLNGEAGRLL